MNLPTICYFHGYVPIAGLAVRADGLTCVPWWSLAVKGLADGNYPTLALLGWGTRMETPETPTTRSDQSENRATIASTCMILAGLVFLVETLFGCIAILPMGFGSLRDISTALALTMAFPIFLIRYLSQRLALLCLWLFFVLQWLDFSSLGQPPKLVNPFDWWHGLTLFLGIVLFTASTAISWRSIKVIS
jgi:hypothetical protein